jgi:hypothetical protein
VTGEKDPALLEPPAALLPARHVRRTSMLTRMCIEVFAQAAGAIDLTSVPTVFGTTYGELETLLALLDQLWKDGEVSPSRFHNSVYNTAGGYLTIAISNRKFTTTIAGGQDTVAMALLEGMVLLEDRGGGVVVIVGDEVPGKEFLPWKEGSLAVAFYLTSERPTQGGLARVSRPRLEKNPKAAVLPDPFAWNPAALALPLVRSVELREPGTVSLSRAGDVGWVMDVLPAEAGA